MKARILLCMLVLQVAVPALAGLTPNDVIVVYNSNAVCPTSELVADYYCSEHGILAVNKFGIDWPFDVSHETISPTDIANTIQTPLRDFLHNKFHSDPNHPESDPVEVIVLCHGVPLNIWGNGRYSSDS